MFRIFAVLLYCLYAIHSLNAQGIEVQISGRKLDQGDYFEVRYSISGDIRNAGFSVNSIPKMQLVQGPMQAISSSSVLTSNGMVHKKSTSISYVFQARETGVVNFPGFKARLLDDKVIEAPGFQIEIAPLTAAKKKQKDIEEQQRQQAAQQAFDPFSDPFFNQFFGNRGRNQQPNQAQSQPQPNLPKVDKDGKVDLSKDIFARIHLSKPQVYVGEEILATIKIYTSVQAMNFEASKVPNFKSFWTKELKMPEKPIINREIINGKEFVSIEVQKIKLIPLEAGKLSITPLNLKTTAVVPMVQKAPQNQRQPRNLFEEIEMLMQQSMGGFNMVEYKQIPYSFSTGSASIDVMALPDHPSKTNAVGKFTAKSYTDKQHLETGKSVNFTFEIEGKGNLSLIQAPKIEFSDKFESFEPKIDEIYLNEANFEGRKIFTFTLIPLSAGDYKLPNINFSYFDLESRTYVTIPTGEIDLKVTGPDIEASELDTKDFKLQARKLHGYIPISTSRNLPEPLFYGSLIGLLALGLIVRNGQGLTELLAKDPDEKRRQIALKNLKKANHLLKEEKSK
nr:BatD family protein [Chitinophagales bacterium]